MDQTTCGSLAYENNFANQQASPQIKHIRPYRLAHQALCLTQIDFDQCIVIGFTQMTIWPLVNNLRWLHINCRQCRIHRIMLEPAGDPSDSNDFDSTGSSVVTRGNLHSSHHNSLPNPMDLPVVYNDPSIEICKRDSKLRTLDSFQRRHTAVVSMADADEGMGEVTIRLPLSYWSFIAAKGPLRITLEFSLTRPKAGFYFVIPAKDGQIYDADDRGIHAFTSASPNSSRLWFPCIDSSEPCTWKIEITVDEDMVAVAPGDLLEAPHYTEDLKRKTYHFYVAVPVSAPCIGLAIGAFDIFPDTRLPNLATHFAPKGLLPILKHTVKPIADIIEYYESLLASEFPFSTMKLVFVDQAYEAEFQSYASLIILPVDLLHSSRIIEQTIATRRILAQAVASQIFGCFIGMHTWCDAWLPLGLAGYLAGLYQRRVFGNNEYRHTTATQMRYVTNFEHTKHGIILDASQTLPVKKTTYFNLKLPQLL
ncbi:unnamed protein product [Protopolystoma xenopodis]|uniref:Transcription initiation factor TFIID subunit 2 n=1 Tax=Protopolystoma xenopodis TaxID=117903 RepID=A0A3S5ABK2_9PLAT|nr:unnamed protein product [Protopolystoma xenopodis]